jgi:hypothetical protein
MEGGTVGHNCERDPPCQVWFNLVQRFQRKRFKCDLLSKYSICIISINRLKEKFHRKTPNICYTTPCHVAAVKI